MYIFPKIENKIDTNIRSKERLIHENDLQSSGSQMCSKKISNRRNTHQLK